MGKGPIQFAPGVVRPIRPLDLKKREYYEEVGRAVVHLSTIENWMANLAWTVAPKSEWARERGQPQTDDDWKVPEMFFAIYGFEKRLRFVDVIMDWHADWEDQKSWNVITSTLSEHIGIRNLVAHLPLTMVYGFGEGLEARLQPHDLDRKHFGKRKKQLGITEIRSAASALEKISRDLESLCMGIWNREPDDSDMD